MAFPALAAAAFIGGGASVLSQRAANKARKRALKKAIASRRVLLNEQGVSGERALAELRGARQDIIRGFSRSRDAFSGAFRSSEVDTLDREQQALASIERDMISSGRWSSNAMDMARMGASATTSRVLTDIASRAAAALADLEARRGGALAGTRGAIAGQINENFNQRSTIQREISDLQAGDQPYAQDYSSEIGTLVGAVEDLFTPAAKTTSPQFQPLSAGERDALTKADAGYAAAHPRSLGGGQYRGPIDTVPPGGGGLDPTPWASGGQQRVQWGLRYGYNPWEGVDMGAWQQQLRRGR